MSFSPHSVYGGEYYNRLVYFKNYRRIQNYVIEHHQFGNGEETIPNSSATTSLLDMQKLSCRMRFAIQERVTYVRSKTRQGVKDARFTKPKSRIHCQNPSKESRLSILRTCVWRTHRYRHEELLSIDEG